MSSPVARFCTYLKNQYPKYYKLKYEKTEIQLEAIQSKLATNTMLLEFFVTDTLVYLFCLTPNHLQVFPLVIDNPFLYRQVNRLRKTLSNWSPFIQLEDNTPISIAAKTNYYPYLVLAIIMIVFMILIARI